MLLAHDNSQNDSSALWGALILDRARKAVAKRYGWSEDFDDLVAECAAQVWSDLQSKMARGLIQCGPDDDDAGALIWGMCKTSSGAGAGQFEGRVNSHEMAQLNRTRGMLDDLLATGLSEASAWLAIDAHRVEHWKQNDKQSVLDRARFTELSASQVSYDPQMDTRAVESEADGWVERMGQRAIIHEVLDGLDPQGVSLYCMVAQGWKLVDAAQELGLGIKTAERRIAVVRRAVAARVAA
ncbi:hypothetical protein [Luteococcus japonicus]|uniref:hypothetical protein n=1 Tax=Luteococcus japonicus TaxID=33984 RepID=UPI000F4A3F63|nr:hypothetical protein [Luteococcus japonicus]